MKKSTKFQIIFSVVFFGILIYIGSINFYGEEPVEKETVGYLKESNEFISPVIEQEEIQKIENNSENYENPKIDIEKTDTLLEYSSDVDVVESAMENQEEMVDGYRVDVNGYTIYIENKNLIDEAKNSLAKIVLDNAGYENYLKTGKISIIDLGDVVINNVTFEDEFKIEKTYVPKDKLLTTTDDVIYSLFHKDSQDNNNSKEIYKVQAGESYTDVLEKNDITDLDFHINNPQYSGQPLLKEGDLVVVNKLDPMINVSIYLEEQKEEVAKFDTIRKQDDNLKLGIEELVQDGKNGKSLVTYEVKLVNGEEKSRNVTKTDMIVPPVNRIIKEGTDDLNGTLVYQDNTPADGAIDGRFIWPSDSRSISRGLQPGHNGTDILSGYGSPVYATQSGTVRTAGWSNGGGGNEVTIDHGNGIYTIYSHMSQPPNVYAGQQVYQGQVIGYMGSSGNSTGVHLHYEVRINASGDAFSGTPVSADTFM